LHIAFAMAEYAVWKLVYVLVLPVSHVPPLCALHAVVAAST
jgi:hypothetical protein